MSNGPLGQITKRRGEQTTINFSRVLIVALPVAIGLVVAPATFAEEAVGTPEYRDLSNIEKTATMSFEVKSVKLIVGGSWGDGMLNFQGKSYPIKVKAATAGGIGYRSIKGVGDVYNLKRLEDFAGVYAGGATGVNVADIGGGRAMLENDKEVIIKAKMTDSEGLQLGLSGGGMQIEFAK